MNDKKEEPVEINYDECAIHGQSYCVKANGHTAWIPSDLVIDLDIEGNTITLPAWLAEIRELV